MRRVWLEVTAVILVSLVSLAAEAIVTAKREDKPELSPQEIRQQEFQKKLDSMPTEPPAIPECNKNKAGRAAEWVINNSDKLSGWSMTGWSKMGLTSDYNPWFLKVGIISGRLASEREMDYVDNSSWKNFADWERREYTCDNTMVFGVHLILPFGGEGEGVVTEQTPEQQLMIAADFYERRSTTRSRKAALFTYNEIVRRFPESNESKLAAAKANSLKLRFPELETTE